MDNSEALRDVMARLQRAVPELTSSQAGRFISVAYGVASPIDIERRTPGWDLCPATLHVANGPDAAVNYGLHFTRLMSVMNATEEFADAVNLGPQLILNIHGWASADELPQFFGNTAYAWSKDATDQRSYYLENGTHNLLTRAQDSGMSLIGSTHDEVQRMRHDIEQKAGQGGGEVSLTDDVLPPPGFVSCLTQEGRGLSLRGDRPLLMSVKTALEGSHSENAALPYLADNEPHGWWVDVSNQRQLIRG